MDIDKACSEIFADLFYEASHINGKRRASKAEMVARRSAIYRIVAHGKPMTVRQVFYQATVHGIIEKTENSYNKIQRDLVEMRRDGSLPYGWLTDSTRWQRKPTTHDSLADALEETARLYRRSLWTYADVQVEVWLEKDALAGVVYPITNKWDVPLMSARGYASLSFLHGAAESITHDGRDAYIYHLGDYDPSGVNAAAKIEETLREMTDVPIHFERLAVLPEQIAAWNLPTRPTKKTDSRAKRFESDISVELDAIDPDELRNIVNDALLYHVDPEQLRVIRAAEESERELLRAFRVEYADDDDGA